MDWMQRLQPVPRQSGLRMEGYHVWCGSAIRVGETYHLFAARWPAATGFPEGYRQHSEIVRATAASPEGPYTFQEVVVGKRAAGRWDSAMAHNPAIYRVGDTFVLFYIGSDEGSAYRQIGVATAPDATGPWKRSEAPLDLGVATDANNPAACFAPDGSVRLVWRSRDLRVYLSEAPSFRGPYRVVNDNLWPGARLEDFFLFRQDGEYRILCEDNAGQVTGHERWGALLGSEDGVHGWQACRPAAVYDHEIRWAAGGALRAVRRERPWLLIEDGRVTCLFTSVWDGEAAWNQPVRIAPPVPASTGA